MIKPSIRIPFTAPLPPGIIFPSSANSLSGAIEALASFFKETPPSFLRGIDVGRNAQTVLLTGAGISVASGLSDYRGEQGTYRRNKQYRPIYFHEFAKQHQYRQRYWARSFVGWPTLQRARPNHSHMAITELANKGYISSVITQNVDSFHSMASLELPITELHGYLRSVVCLSCRHSIPRSDYQENLASLNPSWAEFLHKVAISDGFSSQNSKVLCEKGLQINPDGDVDLADAPYASFRYPACPKCLVQPPRLADGTQGRVEVDRDGAWLPISNAGILKPEVIMFGESIDPAIKEAAEEAVDEAGKLVVLGSSLATFSAWRLVDRARERGMAIGIVNTGGVRNEAALFEDADIRVGPTHRVRCSKKAEDVLPPLASMLPSLGV